MFVTVYPVSRLSLADDYVPPPSRFIDPYPGSGPEWLERSVVDHIRAQENSASNAATPLGNLPSNGPVSAMPLTKQIVPTPSLGNSSNGLMSVM